MIRVVLKTMSDIEKDLAFEEWLKSEKIDVRKTIEEENVIDFPLKVFKNESGYFELVSDAEDEDEIVYSLYMATDSNTGKISIQYKGEDGTFLTQKQVLKVLKKENEIGKHWKIIQ